MLNFMYYNPVKIVFGKGTIPGLKDLIPDDVHRILITYGKGSIKNNGVYDQVVKALEGRAVFEFGGIEANPTYETLKHGLHVVKSERIDFLLSVGGGSVLDGTKFIAAAAFYDGTDAWDLVAGKQRTKITKALPIGCVLTLAATGSEMNGHAVISRKSTQEKFAFGSPLLHPKFSILDPETTMSLPEVQTANGIVDSFVHVFEQYMTYDVNSPIQDRHAEAILKTLLLQAPKVLKNPNDYETRANLMWAATHALNGLIGCGVPHDWSTHMIGHEITALYGLDHAQSLAVILPAVLKHQKEKKKCKMQCYAARVWHLLEAEPDVVYDVAVEKTVAFFHSLGVKTQLSEYGFGDEHFSEIVSRFEKRGIKLGESQAIGPKEVGEILNLCLG